MTKEEAVQKLKEERTISTAMLEPLGFSFESFLRFAQLEKENRDNIVEKLIRRYEEEGV